MAENLNLSARAVAAVLANAKSPKAQREAAEARARAMAAVSKRKAWANLVAAMDAGDTARIAARATGDWSAVKAADAPAPKVAKASPKARKAEAAKPDSKDALAEAAAAMKAAFSVDVDPAKLAAFAAFLAR